MNINKILRNMRKVIKDNPNLIIGRKLGLCDIIMRMNTRGNYIDRVTFDNAFRLHNEDLFIAYLESHLPKGHVRWGMFKWEMGNYTSRLNWLNKHIRLTNTKKK